MEVRRAASKRGAVKLNRFRHVNAIINIHKRKKRHSDYSQTLIQATLWNV